MPNILEDPIGALQNMSGDALEFFIKSTRLNAGFFTPFTGSYNQKLTPLTDGLLTFISPITGIILGAIGAAIAAIVVLLASVFSAAALLSAPFTRTTPDGDGFCSRLLFSLIGIGVTIGAGLAACACALAGALMSPIGGVNFLARSVATVYEIGSECCCSPR